MFDLVQKKKRVVQIILAILVLPFALWGVESYRTSGADAGVATVNGEKITAQQFDRSLRERQNELRRLVGGQVDQALLESPEVRNAVLDALVEQALLVGAAREMRMAVTDAELAAVIREVEAFQKDGSFNKQRYEFALRNQGMTPAMFEARVRQDMAAQRVGETFLRDSFPGKARTENLTRMLEEQREVSVARIKAEDYRDTVKVDDAEVSAYYESHRADYQEPEQIKVRYAVFSADALAPRMAVSDKEVKEYFDGHAAEFGKPEEREASHILITAAADAPTAERALARKKADEVLKEVRAAPDKFAELAKKHSQDPGSAAEGGSLGYFRRGAMVKAFEDATFALKQGEVSDVVESDFGFHIVKLTGIKPAEGASLDEARAGIETRLKQQKAQRQFAEIAEQFSNRAYEQSDSLKPAAEAAGVEVKESDWIPRSGAGAPFPANPKLMEAIFSEEVLKGGRNTEAVEVAPNVLVAARLVEHRPARPKPLDEVKDGIAKRLRDEKAAKLAAEDGAKLLEKLKKGEAAELKWEPAITITRQDSKGLLPLAMREAYRIDPLELPGYAGVEAAPGNYVLVRVNKVSAADQVPPQRKAAYSQRLQEVLAQAELAAFRAALRKSAEITVNRNAIAKPQ